MPNCSFPKLPTCLRGSDDVHSRSISTCDGTDLRSGIIVWGRSMESYRVFGPFELSIERGNLRRRLSRHCLRDLTKDCNLLDSDIASSKGCYVFGLRNRSIKPWYVGKKTKGEKSVISESLNGRNKGQYNTVLQSKKGTPVMFFVIPERRPGPPNQREIKKVELMLISFAWEKNPALLNTNSKEWRWDIPGVWGTTLGRPTKPASIFKSMLGI
jgi:hypothetical protein